jgi:hypothetical protein
MRKLSFSSLFTLLAPVLLLAGGAWWLQNRASPPSQQLQPLQLSVSRVEKVPVLLVERLLGYDTKFKVTYTYRDAPEFGKTLHWSLQPLGEASLTVGNSVVRPRADVLKPLRSSELIPHMYELQQTYLLSLDKIPISNEPLILHDTIELGRAISRKHVPSIVPPLRVELPTSRWSNAQVWGPRSPISFEVRDSGKKATDLPAVEESPFKFLEAKVHRKVNYDGYSPGMDPGGVMINAHISRAHPLFQKRNVFLSIKASSLLVDGEGRHYRSPRDFPVSQVSYVDIRRNGRSDIYDFQFEVSLEKVPLSATRVRFKSEICIDDRYVVPFEVMLREKAVPPSSLSVKSIVKQKIQGRDKLVVRFAYPGTRKLWCKSDRQRELDVFNKRDAPPEPPYLIPDFYVGLVDGNGINVHTRIKTKNSGSPSRVRRIGSKAEYMDDGTCDENRKECTVSYDADLDNVLPSVRPLWFKAVAGLEGEQPILFKVPVRP